MQNHSPSFSQHVVMVKHEAHSVAAAIDSVDALAEGRDQLLSRFRTRLWLGWRATQAPVFGRASIDDSSTPGGADASRLDFTPARVEGSRRGPSVSSGQTSNPGRLPGRTQPRFDEHTDDASDSRLRETNIVTGHKPNLFRAGSPDDKSNSTSSRVRRFYLNSGIRCARSWSL